MRIVPTPESEWLNLVKEFIKSKDENWEVDDYIFPPYRIRTLLVASKVLEELYPSKVTWITGRRKQGFLLEAKEDLKPGEWEYTRGDFTLKGYTNYN